MTQTKDQKNARRRAHRAQNGAAYRERDAGYRSAGRGPVLRSDATLARVQVRAYDLTVSEYNALMQVQKAVCAICGEKDPVGKRLAIDHDHETGRVRGLLCTRCNPGLGYFCDAPERLRRAAEYLEKSLTGLRT